MIEITILIVRYAILKPLGMYVPAPDDRALMREWLVMIGFYSYSSRKDTEK